MEKIMGQLIVNLFFNKDNSYNISKIKTPFGNEVVSGYFLPLEKNIDYEFSGEYIIHKKYGKQFMVSSYKIHIEETKDSLIAYLSSDLFKGVGLILANKIYDLLGDNLISKIKADKSCLDSIMKPDKRDLIYEVIMSNDVLNDILITLYEYGLSTQMAMKIYNKYFDSTIEVIKANPYRLILEVDGFGFNKCDELALKLGFKYDCDLRITNVLLYLINKICFNNGNTYTTNDELINESLGYFNNLISYEKILEILNVLKRDMVISIDEKIFIKEIYYAELGIANKIRKLGENKIKNEKKYLNHLDIVEGYNNISYTNSQKEAIIAGLTNPITIITGSPGTGKTTIIKAILDIYQSVNGINLNETYDCLLLAPTGKAAKRMSEVTKLGAKTIHRGLGYSYDGSFNYNEENKLFAKLIIIDEASMIDIFLANNLFKAIKDNAQVIIVGDENQLPSIAPGNMLSDIIKSNKIKTVFLTEIHRQSLDSGIVALSKMIINNNIDDIIYEYDDIKYIEADNYSIFEMVEKAIDGAIDDGYLFKDIIVLAPLYKGNAGIDMLNQYLQMRYNNTNEYTLYNGIKFKVNDRVIQTVNNPDKRVMNGDTGYILEIIKTKDEEVIVVDFDGIKIKYIKKELEELSLAYALSIHKAQGSEYKVVIMPMLMNYYVMLKKKLIYTGITRAKERLYIIGDKELLKCTYNNDIKKRKTYLCNLLMDYNDKINELEEDNISPYDFM